MSPHNNKQDRKFAWKLRHGLVLPPDTEANMRPYKEPLEAVENGFGFKGTLAHNSEGTHVQCHLCGYFFPDMGSHSSRVHGIDRKEYRKMFQLSAKTPLVAEIVRVKNINNSLKRTQESKEASLAKLKEWRKSRKNWDKMPKKSLEQKNREGRCYYQLLDKIETLGKKLKRTPTRREFVAEYGEGYWGSVKNTFGTWNQALSLAGFTPTHFRGTNTKYSRDTVIAMLRNFYELEGRAPRSSDFGSLIPSGTVITRLFGGIIEARKAAGLGEYDFITERGE